MTDILTESQFEIQCHKHIMFYKDYYIGDISYGSALEGLYLEHLNDRGTEFSWMYEEEDD